MNFILDGNNRVLKRGERKQQKRKLFISVGVVLFALANASALADEPIQIRPHAGVGYLDGATYQHAGLRVLLNAGADKKYGLELTRIYTDKDDYTAAGIVLEQKKFGWFNMSIGPIGYFGMSSGSKHLPGMVVNLGWEADTAKAFKPFVTFRNDVIFADKTISGQSISAGLSVIY